MWAPGGPPGPAGWDRRRVGARLRAALAGLHELQGLRARQQARVRGALAMQPPPGPAALRGPRAHELRLEAALAALQEQLSRLRRQDVGLKTHLDQLDQQISELQLDVRRSSSEAPDSDSRPSSGFYELSDGGSCSLSTSCTSVCSDRLSSSLGTLLPATAKAGPSAGDCRPRSADETTVCGVPLPTWGFQASEEGESRPRPVSTGDLERALPAEVRLQKASAHPKATSLLCHGVDPKFQRDLVSKGGREVYPYPSPLHAVALQSPLFALTKETLQNDSPLPPGQPPPGPAGPSSIRASLGPDAGPAGAYIDKLLRLRGRGPAPRGSVSERGLPRQEATPSLPELSGQRADSEGGLEKLAWAPEGAEGGGLVQRGDAGGDSLPQPGPAPLVDTLHPSSLPDKGPQPSREEAGAGSPSMGCGQAPSPRSRAQQLAPDGWTGRGRSPCGRAGGNSVPLAPGHCAHPHFVASRSSPTGQKMPPPKTKPVKSGGAASDRAGRFGEQPLQWGAFPAPRPPPASGGGLRRPTLARGAPGRSCSESSLYPVSFFVPLLVARREGHRASTQALFPLEAAPLVAAGGEPRRKQHRWRSSAEISARPRLDPSPGPHRPAVRRGGGPQPVCARARPQLPRQDAQARSESGGSEPTSPFHSTIAETSEDEASDHTANRFGDAESGSSDSEGCVQGGGRGPAWAGAAPQLPPRAPAGSRPPLPPVPRLCRVKASKALKKRIRRFQPAALKVMTLV
ncbi:LOW QUALITY PROTEIN: dapper homolog 2 [Camelus ferus]|uniref:LOW QUALITY PROTEIN: dapper homolog 2 n=1 Tax=Camelus ferus TaxID=419612 RepID=A0A8B8TGA2_CAMFR|nr:LOW QUALITY PROTEIN: dapper homolog 2 [Camelus ferus]